MLTTVPNAHSDRTSLAGYSDGEIITSALILGVVSQVLLVVGGYLGGVLTFIYGVRVLNRHTAPPADAVIPGRAGRDQGSILVARVVIRKVPPAERHADPHAERDRAPKQWGARG